MKTIVVCFASYSGEKGIFFDKYTEPRLQKYCDHHNYELLCVKNYADYTLTRQHPTWMSWLIIDSLVEEEKLKDGDNVMSIDADICVYDITQPFVTSKSFGYAIDSCNTHCMGAYTIKVNDWSRKMIKNMLDESRYERLKNTPIWKMWNDQASWYALAGVKRHSWVPFDELPNNGWHSKDSPDTVYSLEELEEHVEIFPVEWNVTHIAGEGFNEFFINPSHRKDTIFRHFAGGPAWDERYFLEEKND